MAITYTWKLTGLKKYDAWQNTDHVVFQTYWKKIGTDENGNTGEFQGATPIDVKNLDTNNFTPYDQLTEEQVLSWVKPVVVGEYERHVNEQIAKAIMAKTVTEVQVNDKELPWVPESERYNPPDPMSVVSSPSGPPVQDPPIGG